MVTDPINGLMTSQLENFSRCSLEEKKSSIKQISSIDFFKIEREREKKKRERGDERERKERERRRER